MKKTVIVASIALLGTSLCVSCSKKEDKKDSESQVTKVETPAEEPQAPKTELKYVGNVNGKYPIHLIVSADRRTGAYYYDKSGVKNYLRISFDKFDEEGDGTVIFNEYNADGKRTGTFTCRLTPDGMEGEGTFYNGKTMPISLSLYDGEDEFPSTEWDLTELEDYEPAGSGSGTSSTASAADIDDLLDRYDSVATDYLKACNSGDMGKIASLGQDLAEIAQELSEVQTEMTPAQLTKLSKIAAKAAKAAGY